MAAKKTLTNLQNQFLAARDKSVPLIAVRTADPAATIMGLSAVCATSDDKIALTAQWDIVDGISGVVGNAAGIQWANSVKGTKITSPVEALMVAKEKLPEYGTLFMMNGNDYYSDPAFRQAMWNVRDPFKRNWRTLVITQAAGSVPLSLEHDFMLIDEPLPGADELAVIVKAQHEAAQLAMPSEEVLLKAVDATSGLSTFAAEQAVALSLRRTGIDLVALRERHRVLIENTKGLSVHRGGEDFSKVGGLKAFITFAQKFLKAARYRPGAVLFIDEIEKALAGIRGDLTGISQDYLAALLGYMQDQGVPGILLMGHPGCQAGDTEIQYNRGERVGTKPMRLDEFYKKFNGIPTSTRPFTDLSWPTYIHSLTDDGVMFRNRVIAVLESGVKELVKVTFDDGSFLRQTPDHPVLTPGCGFVETGNLRVGSAVVAEGSMRPQGQGGRGPQAQRVSIYGVKHHPFAWQKTGGYTCVRRSRLVVEAALNNITYEEFVHALKFNADTCLAFRYIPPDFEVHHLDEDSLNDDLSNLLVMTKVEHARLHGKVENFRMEYVREVKVVNVESQDSEMTYDIQMDDPARNYVANGIVVHNTGKSLLAKSFGNEAGIPTIKCDLGAMHGSLVGESQHALRHALKVTTAVSQGRPIVIATCNSVAILPPELVNRFKWRFFVDLPDKEEKKVIWPVHLAKRGLSLTEKRPDDFEWNGREIEQACETAYQLDCSLVEAADYVVPISQSSAEAMTSRRNEAHGRYLSASKKGTFLQEKRTDDVTVGGRKIDLKDRDTWVAPTGSGKPS